MEEVWSIWHGQLWVGTRNLGSTTIWSYHNSFIPGIGGSLKMTSIAEYGHLWTKILKCNPVTMFRECPQYIQGKTVSVFGMTSASDSPEFAQLAEELTETEKPQILTCEIVNPMLQIQVVIVPQCTELKQLGLNPLPATMKPLLNIIFIVNATLNNAINIYKDLRGLRLSEVGFDELESEDIEDILASHTDELTNEDLQQLTEHSPVEDDDDEEEPQRTLSSKRMAESFNMFQQAMQILIDDDPNREHKQKELQENIDNNVVTDNPKTIKNSLRKRTPKIAEKQNGDEVVIMYEKKRPKDFKRLKKYNLNNISTSIHSYENSEVTSRCSQEVDKSKKVGKNLNSLDSVSKVTNISGYKTSVSERKDENASVSATATHKEPCKGNHHSESNGTSLLDSTMLNQVFCSKEESKPDLIKPSMLKRIIKQKTIKRTQTDCNCIQETNKPSLAVWKKDDGKEAPKDSKEPMECVFVDVLKKRSYPSRKKEKKVKKNIELEKATTDMKSYNNKVIKTDNIILPNKTVPDIVELPKDRRIYKGKGKSRKSSNVFPLGTNEIGEPEDKKQTVTLVESVSSVHFKKQLSSSPSRISKDSDKLSKKKKIKKKSCNKVQHSIRTACLKRNIDYREGIMESMYLPRKKARGIDVKDAIRDSEKLSISWTQAVQKHTAANLHHLDTKLNLKNKTEEDRKLTNGRGSSNKKRDCKWNFRKKKKSVVKDIAKDLNKNISKLYDGQNHASDKGKHLDVHVDHNGKTEVPVIQKKACMVKPRRKALTNDDDMKDSNKIHISEIQDVQKDNYSDVNCTEVSSPPIVDTLELSCYPKIVKRDKAAKSGKDKVTECHKNCRENDSQHSADQLECIIIDQDMDCSTNSIKVSRVSQECVFDCKLEKNKDNLTSERRIKVKNFAFFEENCVPEINKTQEDLIEHDSQNYPIDLSSIGDHDSQLFSQEYYENNRLINTPQQGTDYETEELGIEMLKHNVPTSKAENQYLLDLVLETEAVDDTDVQTTGKFAVVDSLDDNKTIPPHSINQQSSVLLSPSYPVQISQGNSSLRPFGACHISNYPQNLESSVFSHNCSVFPLDVPAYKLNYQANNNSKTSSALGKVTLCECSSKLCGKHKFENEDLEVIDTVHSDSSGIPVLLAYVNEDLSQKSCKSVQLFSYSRFGSQDVNFSQANKSTNNLNSDESVLSQSILKPHVNQKDNDGKLKACVKHHESSEESQRIQRCEIDHIESINIAKNMISQKGITYNSVHDQLGREGFITRPPTEKQLESLLQEMKTKIQTHRIALFNHEAQSCDNNIKTLTNFIKNPMPIVPSTKGNVPESWHESFSFLNHQLKLLIVQQLEKLHGPYKVKNLKGLAELLSYQNFQTPEQMNPHCIQQNYQKVGNEIGQNQFEFSTEYRYSTEDTVPKNCVLSDRTSFSDPQVQLKNPYSCETSNISSKVDFCQEITPQTALFIPSELHQPNWKDGCAFKSERLKMQKYIHLLTADHQEIVKIKCLLVRRDMSYATLEDVQRNGGDIYIKSSALDHLFAHPHLRTMCSRPQIQLSNRQKNSTREQQLHKVLKTNMSLVEQCIKAGVAQVIPGKSYLDTLSPASPTLDYLASLKILHRCLKYGHRHTTVLVTGFQLGKVIINPFTI
ncbi:hypothetical protein Hamer_G013601 [Homarus americanus]|uniref:Uncharacterized protein n=1 Tax=Homarus americanus TaxID=6706 RepID=A0A8J5KEA8_HOMAM|nr:hypothetical protein Hamer_G013601 [Homarus americanus]